MTTTASGRPEPVLKVEHLTKTYASAAEEVTATFDVSFEVGRGELVLVMGPSGSGKTTLLLLCGGLLAPTAGGVWIAGTEITALSERRLPKLRLTRIGFVFQMANLLANLTAAENVRIVLEAAGCRRADAQRRAEELLASLGLDRRADHLPAELSGGQRQRVAIARALANRPPLILADEPTGALDSRTGAAVMDVLRRRIDTDGTCMVCVTHDPRIAGLADRVLWLEDGRLSEAGASPGEASGRYGAGGHSTPDAVPIPPPRAEHAVQDRGGAAAERHQIQEDVPTQLGTDRAEGGEQRAGEHETVGEEALLAQLEEHAGLIGDEDGRQQET